VRHLSCMVVGLLSRSVIIKGGTSGYGNQPMFTVPTVPSQTLATQSDREGVEARGTTHCAADRHRYYVVLLIGSMYIHVIPRL
jgi:hypothetical protein